MITTAFLLGALNRGGAETLVLDIFKSGQNKLNFIGIYRKEGNLSENFTNCGVRMIKIEPGGKFDVMYIFRLRRFLKRNKVNIVHSHQLIDGAIGMLCCLFSHRRSVLTFHGHELNKPLLMQLLRKTVLKYNHKNVFVSNSQLGYFQKHNNINFRQQVIYNGINLDKFRQKHSIREELCIPDNTLLTGSVGNFTPVRDHLFVCKFLKELLEANIKFVHLFIGSASIAEPQILEECTNYCQNNLPGAQVIFLGHRNDVPSILPQLDAFFYATRTDTFGIAIIEAMACKVPVFVNNNEVMLEITDNGTLANIYETGNVKSLLVLFIDFLKNKNTYLSRAKQASEVVNHRYSINKHLENLVELYKTL
ncbi:MAG: glycosyltransferase [Bacteroidales bacterium]|nr:glycosyltransferase [Bacteroidales bacterium]